MTMTIWTDGDAILFAGPWPLTTIELHHLRQRLRQADRADWPAIARSYLEEHRDGSRE